MQFQVVDIKTGAPVQNVSANTIDLQTNNLLYQPTLLDGSAMFEMDVDVNPQYGIYLSAPGYKTLSIPFNILFQSQDGVLYMEKQFPTWLLGLTAVALVASSNNKVGNPAAAATIVKNLNLQKVPTAVKYAAGGVLLYFVYKTLVWWGVLKSGDTINLDNAATNPNNFWNPNFYKTKPAYVDWTAPITYNDAVNYAKQLYDAFGWVNDNEEQAIAVFKSFRAQSSVSYLADVFSQIYGQDLLTFLRGGSWPQDRLSDADVQTINAYISRLPKY